jgi:uncharacterized protein (DUF302 family)
VYPLDIPVDWKVYVGNTSRIWSVTGSHDAKGNVVKTAYGLKARTRLGMAEAEAKVRELLAGEGFGILTEIDVAATLHEKLGLDRDPYRILGACNPNLAAEALDREADVGLLLPCNVIVYQDGEETVVAAMDPETMVDLTDNPALAQIAGEARSRLEHVIGAMSEEDADA